MAPVAAPADEWTKLTSVPSKYEANLLAGSLREAGIPSRIVKATTDPSGWLKAYGTSHGVFNMYVPATKRRVARHLLLELGSSESPHADRSYHGLIRLIGRGLLALVMGLFVAMLVLEALN